MNSVSSSAKVKRCPPRRSGAGTPVWHGPGSPVCGFQAERRSQIVVPSCGRSRAPSGRRSSRGRPSLVRRTEPRLQQSRHGPVWLVCTPRSTRTCRAWCPPDVSGRFPRECGRAQARGANKRNRGGIGILSARLCGFCGRSPFRRGTIRRGSCVRRSASGPCTCEWAARRQPLRWRSTCF